jgi:hypothetical protein
MARSAWGNGLHPVNETTKMAADDAPGDRAGSRIRPAMPIEDG